MSALLIPVAFAGVFVAGCLAIQSFPSWSAIVSQGLAWIYTTVVILLAAEILVNHMPRQYADLTPRPAQATRPYSEAMRVDPTGTRVSHKGFQAFRD